MLVCAPGAAGEFHRLRLAQHNHALIDQPTHYRRGGRRAMIQPAGRTSGGDPPFDVDDVLDRDRNAVPGAERMA